MSVANFFFFFFAGNLFSPSFDDIEADIFENIYFVKPS